MTTTERRALDRTLRAHVTHSNGGYAITDGLQILDCHDLADAFRRAYIHNHIAGFNPTPAELRTYEESTND